MTTLRGGGIATQPSGEKVEREEIIGTQLRRKEEGKWGSAYPDTDDLEIKRERKDAGREGG